MGALIKARQRELLGLPPLEPPSRYKQRVCQGCGTGFTAVRTDARFCSDACRQRSYRVRRRRQSRRTKRYT